MHKRIAVGFDGTERAADAIRLATELADETAEMTLVGILPSVMLATVGTLTITHGDSEGEIEFERRLSEMAERHGAKAHLARSSSPARGLHDVAAEIEADLVVVGSPESTMRGRSRAGRVASQLLQGGEWAVALSPVGFSAEEMSVKTIGIAYDGSPESQRALEETVEFARREGAAIKLIGVASITWSAAWAFALDEMTDAAKDSTDRILDEAVKLIPDEVETSKVVRIGDPASEILGEAREGVDVLVMGSRGYGPFRRVLLGSVSSIIVKEAPCAVLVLPRGDHESRE